MIRQHLIPFLAVLLLIQSTHGHAQGPIVRKQLKLAEFNSRPVSKVDIREINLAPGQKGPLHKHPCPVVGYIVSGSILFQVKGDSAIILKAGDPFYEPEGAVISHFDNASGDMPAKFILNYLMDKEKEFIILLDDKERPVK
ncbi:cupin domain-containing protein [Flavitalea sp. BT771]|uniref:cupin domain-containing protein n=1 Tax=Flavitalea sp. BT771 TaxID=3063329 RepID=UPI0026E406F0|nr:cupin domain-containing protein [Flavitalea sp. BT771]MDO6429749.1 cupin domain-containing protein [Flavitalea sp. BT771]MDV6218123.1 cupin domain-containing protein [Flavitalea sp. BT771]